VRLRLDFVGAPEVARLYAAADAAVLNYREVFSSGALPLALSEGVPMVAPPGGTAAEVAGPALEPIVDGDVPAAVAAVRRVSSAARGEAARSAGRAASWESMAVKIASASRGEPDG